MYLCYLCPHWGVCVCVEAPKYTVPEGISINNFPHCLVLCCASATTIYHICIIFFLSPAAHFESHIRGSWYVIPNQGLLKLKRPVWVPVRAQQKGHGIVGAAAGEKQPILARSLNPPFRHWARGGEGARAVSRHMVTTKPGSFIDISS